LEMRQLQDTKDKMGGEEKEREKYFKTDLLFILIKLYNTLSLSYKAKQKVETNVFCKARLGVIRNQSHRRACSYLA
jgi:hypothetical protein